VGLATGASGYFGAVPTAVHSRPAIGRAPSHQFTRIGALDAVRGLAIALMVFVNNPGDGDAMPAQFVHSPWHGYRLAEVVFPLFLFSVGVSMAVSCRSAAARPMLRRAALLFVIGCVLVSVKYRHVAPSTGTLQLIAGASLLAWAARRWLSRHGQLAYAAVVLVGLALGFTVTGWGARTNLAARVDGLVLGEPSDLGLLGMVSASTLVLAGTWVGAALRRAPTPAARAALAGRAGVLATTAGLVAATAIPLNKRIWTPSYIVVSFGLACLVLAAFLWWDGRRLGRTGLGPLETLGTNPLIAYVVTSLAATTVLEPVREPVVTALARWSGGPLAAVLWAAGVLMLAYVVCRAFQRRGVFVRV
jgi:predicted acyltransferase